MKVPPGEIVTPTKGHECPRPDRNELRVSTDSSFPASHYIHLVNPSVPPGSVWRCPECGARWRVYDKNTRSVGVAFCGRFAWEWEKRSSGWWWRRFHRLADSQGQWTCSPAAEQSPKRGGGTSSSQSSRWRHFTLSPDVTHEQRGLRG